jgi:polyhydroxybutyrate depolymerase
MMRRLPMIADHARISRRLGTAALATLAVAAAITLNLACGTSATQGSAGNGSSPASAGSSSQPFGYQHSSEVHRTCDAAQVAARLPPIVYRPPGLPSTQKVPLLIALHGALSTPQAMEGLSHFEAVANRYRFVVVYPGSCIDPHPWGPPQDFTYLSTLIPQLIASQNVDPARVYVTGFSAGGYASWLIGCRLSRQVAGIAIVSNAMAGSLYRSCPLSRPVSQLLMIGTLDGARFTGIPGRVPSPFQSTARWRTFDGCAAQPVTATAPLPVVSQEVWSACTDRSAVSLILVQGAHHVWPPYGVGAPTNYSASLAVWAFLSSHTGAPLSLTTTDAKLMSIRASPSASGRTKLTATLRVAEPLTIVATLGSSQTPPRTTYLTRLGQRTVTVSWSFRIGSRRSYRVVLTFQDAYGRTRRVGRSVNGG